MMVAAAPSISVGSSHCQFCHAEVSGCFTSYAVASSWIKSPHDSQRFVDQSSLRCQSPLFGTTQLHWLHVGREICQSKVSVAADYSDSVPDSSNYVRNHGYHPLEELKVCKSVRDTQLTPPEIARTTVEAHSSALLIFPSVVHREPHEYISWAEFPYVIDEYGDIFFQIFDDENILQDRGASNPVNVLVAMDISTYENRKAAAAEYDISDMTDSDDIQFIDEYSEVEDNEMSDISVEWGMPTDNVNEVHPIYFSKCLAKAVSMEYDKMMDYPSNGVSIVGFLRPALMSEELYLRRLFIGEDSDEYASEWKDGEASDFRHEGYGNRTCSTLYRLEIMRIELFSIYGIQSTIDLQDFQEAEPDVLVHCNSAIIGRLSENGMRCNVALKALCKKKGLYVEGANLIGVDSLGMDVRIFTGTEVQTYRFPFKVQATSEGSAEKQINRLLFPRAHRKKFKMHADGYMEI